MLLLALLIAAGPAPTLQVSEPGAKAPRAAILLRMQRFVRVEEVLSLVPEPSPLQRLQHTQALLGMGRCTAAEAKLPILLPKQKNSALSQKFAACFAHHQQWHRAAEWGMRAESESSELKPGQSATLWLMLSRAGMEVEADAVAHRAAERAPANTWMTLMQAKRAVDRGDVAAVDAALWALPEGLRVRPNAQLINAELELDLGNLAAAERHAKAALEGGSGDEVRAIALLAESRRRMGWSFGAAMVLKRKPLLVAHHPRLRAVAIRISVDRGDLETAQRLLAVGLDEGFADPELFASAWYLHHHLQDGQADAWALRWSRVNESELRSLEQL